MREFSFCFLFRFLFEKALFGRSLAQLVLAALSRYPFGAVTGGDALQAPLAMYPFGIKEGPNGISIAMHPSVGFAFRARAYVSKGRRFLSDAPFGRFP